MREFKKLVVKLMMGEVKKVVVWVKVGLWRTRRWLKG